jgi:hypothetical protein
MNSHYFMEPGSSFPFSHVDISPVYIQHYPPTHVNSSQDVPSFQVFLLKFKTHLSPPRYMTPAHPTSLGSVCTVYEVVRCHV